MIPVSKPNLSGNELQYLTEAIRDEWVSSKGPKVKELEEKFAAYIGTKYAIACSSGTTALTLALAALGIQEGDEVIVPDFTMIATAWAVSYLGATPVFVDCGRDLNIDPAKIEEKITSKTKAIMPVHIYGRPVDMEAVMRIAYEYNLHVVEDCAEAHGATFQGKKVGAFGDAGCFSLFGNKIITAGEGGLVTTNDERLYRQLDHLRSMAFDTKHTFLHKKIGFNFRMTNLQAAVAVAQLEQIDEFLVDRRQIAAWYDVKLGAYVLPRPEGSVNWMYDIVLPSEEIRDAVMQTLARHGIESRYFFKPMTMQPMYATDYAYRETEAFDFSLKGIYLPLYPGLKKEEVDRIAGIVQEVIQRHYLGFESPSLV